MRFYLLIFLAFTCFHSLAQTSLSATVIDYGEVSSTGNRYADITIRNTGDKKEYLLRIEHSPDVVYRVNSEIISPDSTFHLRFQVNPKQKGSFNYVARIYLSDKTEPIELRLKGTLIDEINYDNYLTKCPEFGSKAPIRVTKTDLTIITVDKETGKRLSKSSVTIIRNGQPAGAWITGSLGKFNLDIPSGFFYFFATHDGYLNKEAGVYVGPEISEITIPLSKDPSFGLPPPDPQLPEVIAEEATEIPAEEVKEILEQQMKNEQSDSVIKIELPALAEIDPANFDRNLFKDVNVVFALDISSSMKMGDKMTLLKFSLNQLVEGLRPTDLMGIITYADNAEVFIHSTPGDRKEVLKTTIERLEPRGMTAGGKGIKLAYKQVMKTYDPAKTNMVIVITDGAFNKESDNYQKLVRKYSKKGIIFSVVGIQTKPKDAVKMTEAANFGKGRYVPIVKLSDAQFNLLQEIRIASFKGV